MSTLNKNIHQAIQDFDGIQQAIIDKGVDVPSDIPTSEYGEKIREIETGITPSGTISITENGDYNVAEYAEASVNVSGGDSGATLNPTFDIESGVLTKGKISVEGELTLTIPDGVAEIGEGAFINNAGIELITALNIPNSVTHIGKTAFSGCINLRNLVIPNSVTSIDVSAFYDCRALTELTIPNSVEIIGPYAFRGCNALISLTIPDSVTSIGVRTFYGCNALTELTIPGSVTSIDQYAFDGCNALIELTIPNSVTSIGPYAFRGCNALTFLSIPNSVTSIGNDAFSGCYALTDIYYSGTEEEWNAIAGLANAGFKGTETIHYNYAGDGSEL